MPQIVPPEILDATPVKRCTPSLRIRLSNRIAPEAEHVGVMFSELAPDNFVRLLPKAVRERLSAHPTRTVFTSPRSTQPRTVSLVRPEILNAQILESLKGLSIPERIQIVEDLWDSIAIPQKNIWLPEA